MHASTPHQPAAAWLQVTVADRPNRHKSKLSSKTCHQHVLAAVMYVVLIYLPLPQGYYYSERPTTSSRLALLDSCIQHLSPCSFLALACRMLLSLAWTRMHPAYYWTTLVGACGTKQSINTCCLSSCDGEVNVWHRSCSCCIGVWAPHGQTGLAATGWAEGLYCSMVLRVKLQECRKGNRHQHSVESIAVAYVFMFACTACLHACNASSLSISSFATTQIVFAKTYHVTVVMGSSGWFRLSQVAHAGSRAPVVSLKLTGQAPN
jgi:hypothetical protein